MKTLTCSGMDLLCNDYRLLASSSLEPTVIAASYLAFCLQYLEEVHKNDTRINKANKAQNNYKALLYGNEQNVIMNEPMNKCTTQ